MFLFCFWQNRCERHRERAKRSSCICSTWFRLNIQQFLTRQVCGTEFIAVEISFWYESFVEASHDVAGILWRQIFGENVGWKMKIKKEIFCTAFSKRQIFGNGRNNFPQNRFLSRERGKRWWSFKFCVPKRWLPAKLIWFAVGKLFQLSFWQSKKWILNLALLTCGSTKKLIFGKTIQLDIPALRQEFNN